VDFETHSRVRSECDNDNYYILKESIRGQVYLNMDKIIIYLANLSHVDCEGHPATDSIPLNIGFLASYIKGKFESKVSIELFNIPSKLEDAFNIQIPNILACSNYAWNTNLNYYYISCFKEKYPQVVTIMGGPNYPRTEEKQKDFLERYNEIDFYLYEEGEIGFFNLIERLSRNEFNIEDTKNDYIKGCHCISEGCFKNGGVGERLRDVNELPSPYLAGLFDNMLKEGFVPIIQTNRGCPFSCIYCHSSSKYYNKLYKFDFNRVCEEIEYIGKRVKTKYLFIADDNFGIFRQDLEIAKSLMESKKKYSWPLQTTIATSKTKKEFVLKCVSQLGDTIYFTASMQSMNGSTLNAIKRDNLSFKEQRDIIKELKKNNVRSFCELILGLPEETRESHLKGIKEVLDANIDRLGIYTCMLLKGTPLAEDRYYDQYQMLRKFRIIPRDYGIYMGKKVIETEEVCVGTKDLSFDDYIFLRGFHFVISNYFTLDNMKEIVHYLKYLNISIFDWLLKIHEKIQKNKGRAGEIYNNFVDDAIGELWDSEDEILKYYDDMNNFQRILDGMDGANLMQKYGVIILNNLRDFIDLCVDVAVNNFESIDVLAMKNLATFCLCRKHNILSEPFSYHKEHVFDFDVLRWTKDGMESDIKDFYGKTKLRFFLNEKQEKTLKDYLNFYGSKEKSMGIILSRINPTFLYRDCVY
jgi:radical SAM superfamily enzyme YgiQ (UPF0313 family)